MAEFRTASLGNVLQTAEALKGMRRQAESDRLRDMYMGVQMRNAEQAGAIAADENRRAQETHVGQQRALEAKRVYHVASAILGSDDPIDAIQQLAPDLVIDFEKARGQGSFAQLTPELAKQMAGEMRQKSAIAAGIQPKYGSPQTGQQNGQDVFFQIDENDPSAPPRVLPGIQPRPQKKGPGLAVTMPDGTVVQMGEDGVPNYGGVGLTKPNQTKLQEAFINAQGNAYALREQLAKYRPEFSTMGGRFKAGVANIKEQVGMENAPQQQQFLADMTSWKSDTARLLSQYLNQLSGAAISPHEETRLKAGFPNAEDGPTQYLSKAQATMRNFALVQARAAYLLSNPAQSLDSVSLDSMSSIIAGEANRLAKAYEQGGMDAAQAKERAIVETRTRFGMGE
jgi:hypothetical protein